MKGQTVECLHTHLPVPHPSPPPATPPTPLAPSSAGVQPETGTGGGEEHNAIHPHKCMDKWHLHVWEPLQAETNTLIYLCSNFYVSMHKLSASIHKKQMCIHPSNPPKRKSACSIDLVDLLGKKNKDIHVYLSALFWL